MTALEIEATFPDQDACKAYLASSRWPYQVSCPRCDNPNVYALDGSRWQCHRCNPKGYQFSVLVGTPFENTKIPLKDWFRTIHLLLTEKNVTIGKVQRYIGISNRSAWSLRRRVRRALRDDDFCRLVGIVNLNEVGQQPGPHLRWPESVKAELALRCSTDQA